MTGADPAAFADIGAAGEIFDVDSGRISPPRVTGRRERRKQGAESRFCGASEIGLPGP